MYLLLCNDLFCINSSLVYYHRELCCNGLHGLSSRSHCHPESHIVLFPRVCLGFSLRVRQSYIHAAFYISLESSACCFLWIWGSVWCPLISARNAPHISQNECLLAMDLVGLGPRKACFLLCLSDSLARRRMPTCVLPEGSHRCATACWLPWWLGRSQPSVYPEDL